jgi:hypothetical protein
MAVLPTPEEFAALVAAWPDVPEIPVLVTIEEIAAFTGVAVSGVESARRKTVRAHRAGTHHAGLMPEPDTTLPVLRWRIDAVVRWRAAVASGEWKTGGRPPADISGLLPQAREIIAELGRPVNANELRHRLGIPYSQASRVLAAICYSDD